RVETGAGFADELHWTHAWDGAEPGNWARWSVALSEPGTYRVEVYIAAGYGGTQAAKYGVAHAGAETILRRDISAASGWLWLDDFEFAATGNEHVIVRDDTGEPLNDARRVPADAVRLTRIDVTDGGDPDGGDSDPGANAAAPGCPGGCASLDVAGPWALLALLYRRRRRALVRQ
ncbi:MAG: hypothetical protein HYZ27_10800, partial [Deltaproteobacteria bacterium]|nr:hypothetical protein [Deltaproteobacteria bacterium]